jgi:hypothetical protein
MTPTSGRGGTREHRPPMTVEVDHAIVVSLRPVARQRDVNVARLVRASADDIVDICDRIEKARAALVQATSRYDKPAGDV